METVTGIEIELRASKATETVAKVFQALHLDTAVTKLQAAAIKVVVSIDGSETTFPMHAQCIVPCAAGRRKLDVSLLGVADITGLGRRISHATAEVDVERGCVTIVNFVMGLGIASYELAVVGTRPG